jgi:truncated hemoglobin YjbI
MCIDLVRALLIHLLKKQYHFNLRPIFHDDILRCLTSALDNMVVNPRRSSVGMALIATAAKSEGKVKYLP